MSTNSLKELVDAIKTRGKALADDTGASAATSRDLVYLSTAAERLFGADAMLSMINEATKPAEVITFASTTTAYTLTDEQVSRTIVKFLVGVAMSSSEVVVTAPTKGCAFIIDNSLPVPIKVKTLGQTSQHANHRREHGGLGILRRNHLRSRHRHSRNRTGSHHAHDNRWRHDV